MKVTWYAPALPFVSWGNAFMYALPVRGIGKVMCHVSLGTSRRVYRLKPRGHLSTYWGDADTPALYPSCLFLQIVTLRENKKLYTIIFYTLNRQRISSRSRDPCVLKKIKIHIKIYIRKTTLIFIIQLIRTPYITLFFKLTIVTNIHWFDL